MRIRNQEDIEEGVLHLKQNCEMLRVLEVQCPTIPLRLSAPDFAGLASIIVSQQVSRASADAIFNRLRDAVDPLTGEGFLRAGEGVWKTVGLSRPKQRTLSAVAHAVMADEIDLAGLCEFSVEEAMERLVAIKGIGPWTAEVYLMFCAGHRDVFPAGDLALQEALRLGFAMSERPNEQIARELAERWAPWRAVAARILWAYYGVVKRDAMPV